MIFSQRRWTNRCNRVLVELMFIGFFSSFHSMRKSFGSSRERKMIRRLFNRVVGIEEKQVKDVITWDGRINIEANFFPITLLCLRILIVERNTLNAKMNKISECRNAIAEILRKIFTSPKIYCSLVVFDILVSSFVFEWFPLLRFMIRIAIFATFAILKSPKMCIFSFALISDVFKQCTEICCLDLTNSSWLNVQDNDNVRRFPQNHFYNQMLNSQFISWSNRLVDYIYT